MLVTIFTPQAPQQVKREFIKMLTLTYTKLYTDGKRVPATISNANRVCINYVKQSNPNNLRSDERGEWFAINVEEIER